MCDVETVLSVAALLLAATGFCIYQVSSEMKARHHSEIKSQGPCENEYRKYRLNGGEWFYLVDEDLVGCNYTWLFGGKRCEKYMWWD